MTRLPGEDDLIGPVPLVRISRGKRRRYGDFVAGLYRHTLDLGFLHADAKRHHCRKGAHEFVDSVRDHCRISSQFTLMPGIAGKVKKLPRQVRRNGIQSANKQVEAKAEQFVISYSPPAFDLRLPAIGDAIIPRIKSEDR